MKPMAVEVDMKDIPTRRAVFKSKPSSAVTAVAVAKVSSPPHNEIKEAL